MSLTIHNLHPWDLAPADAIRLQNELAAQIVTDQPLPLDAIRLVGGVDVSVKDNISRAAVVILRYPQLDVIEAATAERPTTFPYIPGLLSFREGAVILDAMRRLATAPDVFIFDGQGIAHPRRLGIADGDLGRLLAVVVRVRHEVLEDDLLDVAEPHVKVPDDRERLLAVLHRLADPDQDPGRERYREPAGVLDHVDPDRRVFSGGVTVGGDIRGRLEHQPHAGVDGSEPVEFLVGEDPGVRVRQKAASYGLDGEVVDVVEYVGIPYPAEHGVESRHRSRALPEGEERLRAAEACARLHGAERIVGRHDASLPYRRPETAIAATVPADRR